MVRIHCNYTITFIYVPIDEFSYRAWHFITSFIDYAIQIYVGQKARENQWRVVVIEEFLHTALLYQASNTRNINAVAVLEQYLVLVEKENGMTISCTVGFCERVNKIKP